MIKFKYKYPDGFIPNFKTNFVLNYCGATANATYVNLSATCPAEAHFYQEFFSQNFILSLVFCKTKNLKRKITEVYEKYPVMADRFNPSWIFSQYNFNFELIYLDLRLNHNEILILNYKPELLEELQKIVDEKQSKLAAYYVEQVNLATNAKKIKNTLARIRNVYNGTSKLLKGFENNYPLWFKDIETIFNYRSLRANYGRTIIRSSSLNVCPYCNVREIEIVKGIDTTASPDIDHFYPKSRYPFLAVSLNNFVPSCGYCNQKFKRDKDTFHGHLHPLINGTRNYNVFKFSPVLDELPEITLQGCDGFKKNISMFELKAVYKNTSYLKEYKKMADLLETMTGLSGSLNKVIDNKNILYNAFSIGKDHTVLNTPKHKFKLDVFSHLTHNSYRN